MDYVITFLLGIIIVQNIILHLTVLNANKKRMCECNTTAETKQDPYKDWRDPVTGLLKSKKYNSM